MGFERYDSWSTTNGLGAKVGAFVDGAGNFVASLGIPRPVAVAIMAVLVASFAATTLDTATRLQRYVVQELADDVQHCKTTYEGQAWRDSLRPRARCHRRGIAAAGADVGDVAWGRAD